MSLDAFAKDCGMGPKGVRWFLKSCGIPTLRFPGCRVRYFNLWSLEATLFQILQPRKGKWRGFFEPGTYPVLDELQGEQFDRNFKTASTIYAEMDRRALAARCRRLGRALARAAEGEQGLPDPNEKKKGRSL